MPTRTIELVRAAQQTGTSYGRISYRFTVTAQNATGGLSNAIFRYLRQPLDPSNLEGTQEDIFSGICRPEELASLPLNNPREYDDPAWLRLATLDLFFASEEEANAAWIQLQADVRLLLRALAKADLLSEETTVVLTAAEDS